MPRKCKALGLILDTENQTKKHSNRQTKNYPGKGFGVFTPLIQHSGARSRKLSEFKVYVVISKPGRATQRDPVGEEEAGVEKERKRGKKAKPVWCARLCNLPLEKLGQGDWEVKASLD